MPDKEREPTPADVADRMHSAAIRLLRYVRKEDVSAGVSATQLSALSVLVFGGPQTMSALAAIEQVRLPTMSKLVSDLAVRGLVTRMADPTDRRIARVVPTQAGRDLLEEGRRKRLVRLVAAFVQLSPGQLSDIASAAETIIELTDQSAAVD